MRPGRQWHRLPPSRRQQGSVASNAGWLARLGAVGVVGVKRVRAVGSLRNNRIPRASRHCGRSVPRGAANHVQIVANGGTVPRRAVAL